MIGLVSHFESNERSRHSEWLRQGQWFIKAKQETKQRADSEDRLDSDILAMASEVVMATQIQIQEFQIRLDSYESQLDNYETRLDIYDEVIVKALMENQDRLDVLYAERNALLDGAFVVEDGRRVFKSADGVLVEDEFGSVVPPEELLPEMVPDHLVNLESFKANSDAIIEANQEREKLFDAQDGVSLRREELSDARTKLGGARSKADTGEMTVDEIEELDAELAEAMPGRLPTLPISAMKHITAIESAIDTPNATSAFTNNADPAAALHSPNHNPAFQPG